MGEGVDVETFRVLKDFGAEFIQRHHRVLTRRVEEGWIRDVHGDLHCDHVCFAPEGIQIFDCIEFSAGLRGCDLASEIPFLLMDLDFRGAKQRGAAFLERYLELMGDRGTRGVVAFIKGLPRARSRQGGSAALPGRLWHSVALFSPSWSLCLGSNETVSSDCLRRDGKW